MTARGSHRPSLATLVRRTLPNALGGITAPRRLLVATSGGPDSQALLHVLAGLRGELDLELHAHGVDHGLRAHAGAELDLAEALARTLDVPFARTRVKVAAGGNVQARAREARFTALRAAARRFRAKLIATAHHADDRAETVLLRLLRGTSLGSLGVLPLRDGDLVRPLLAARRRDVELHLERHGVPFATDPSNADPRFRRTRVRGELLPLLEHLNPRMVEHLNLLADEALALRSAQVPTELPFPTKTRAAVLELLRDVGGAKGAARAKAKRARIALPGGLVLRLDEAAKKSR